jgi:hypothetical protein
MPSKTKKAAEPVQSSQEDTDVSMTDAPPVVPEEQLPFIEEQRIRIVYLPSLVHAHLELTCPLPVTRIFRDSGIV